MMNLLLNGGFDGNLYGWTGTGVIARSLGYPRLGCVQLAAGQSMSQAVGAGANALYTLHFFYRLGAGASLTAGYGSVTQVFSGGVVDVWQEGVLAFALDVGANSNVTFTASGGTLYVDEVALLLGGLPIARAEIATRLAKRLGALATDAALSSVASASGPEGDYSEAIDEALRSVGALNLWGDPDVTLVRSEQVNDLLESAQTAMLQRLRSSYALETDVTLGPRRESRSQIATSIDAMLGGGSGGGGGNRRVSQGSLTHGEWGR